MNNTLINILCYNSTDSERICGILYWETIPRIYCKNTGSGDVDNLFVKGNSPNISGSGDVDFSFVKGNSPNISGSGDVDFHFFEVFSLFH